MAKTIVFYTPAELKELKPFVNGEIKATKENLEEFCKKNNRNFQSVQVKIYGMRKGRTRKTKRTASKTQAQVTKNEFIIPITRWEIRNDEKGNNLILHFSK